jgi:hypothetical protein
MVGIITEWQNMKNIRGHRLGQRQREQSLDGKMWKILEASSGQRQR